MAAVLCLVMIPLIASIGFMFGVVGGEHGASWLAGAAFFLLAAFMLGGMFSLSRVWDEEKTH